MAKKVRRVRRNRYGFKAVGTLMMISCVTAAILGMAAPAQAATKSPTYYVSLGDSYSVGDQPGAGPRRATRP